MRLVTYLRGGARRLGALVEGVVVDLPDAVGHPAFPPTLEALVARNGGSTLDAARVALMQPDVTREFRVRKPRLLVPYLPPFRRERILGPGDEVPWPGTDPTLDHNPQLACIVGRTGHSVTPKQAAGLIFGYTIMVSWSQPSRARGIVALSFGPCVVTADDFAPRGGSLVSKLDGRVSSEVPLAPAAWIFPEMVAIRSMTAKGTRPGMLLASPLRRRTRGLGTPLEPGSVVEVEADGIGRLQNVLGVPATVREPRRATRSLSREGPGSPIRRTTHGRPVEVGRP